MSILATVIGLALALLPLVIGYVARSKGRSALTWSLLSLVLTPFGSLILLLMLPERDLGTSGELGGGSPKLGTLSASFTDIVFGDGAEEARHAELDQELAAEARVARVDQLIAERLNALRASPEPSMAPIGVTAAGAARPTFGKRR